ncbi:hypothetical protein LOTGIDRAFT_155169 [Lottia gigantea]|uniref:Uncharacterized protein n=1 Tax=Lottia gigantea TaxID=225164 RepID=V3Z4Q8_LOTGI|nr:hypothetical protein LOTGIDRAFT_155169 [Lottia gigantea]ESO85678.1 hypothetical protein LOTGIDRAFT_155169 [Lottia gigantea]
MAELSLGQVFLMLDINKAEKTLKIRVNLSAQPNFQLKSDLFSDITSEDELPVQDNKADMRFGTPLNQNDLNNLVKDGLSKKTESKSKWAVNLFQKWRAHRDGLNVEHRDILHLSNEHLNMLFGYFIAEIKNEKGDDYKPNTLLEIIISIQYYMRQNGRFLSMMDDGDFRGMKAVLDSKMKDLNRQGKGVQRRQADIINEKHENMMWNNGILGTSSPQQLLDTLVFQLSLHFALRAGQEHCLNWQSN